VGLDPKRSDRLWRVRCDCGVERVWRTDLITTGHNKSCGCQRGKRTTGLTIGALALRKAMAEHADLPSVVDIKPGRLKSMASGDRYPAPFTQQILSGYVPQDLWYQPLEAS
jgi:hypothetical protein